MDNLSSIFVNPPESAKPGVLWENRLIGDEQEPSDVEWLPGDYWEGLYLKEFPDWLLEKEPRPSKGRYCFSTWNYFTEDSPLIPSGFLGPVKIIKEDNK